MQAHDIMKQPQTDTSKFSLPGILAVKRVNGESCDKSCVSVSVFNFSSNSATTNRLRRPFHCPFPLSLED